MLREIKYLHLNICYVILLVLYSMLIILYLTSVFFFILLDNTLDCDYLIPAIEKHNQIRWLGKDHQEN